MNTVAISEFRQNMSSYLEKVKMRQQPLVLWKRNKPEFVIVPTLSAEDREMYNSTWFWKRLDEARKSKTITLEEAKKALGLT
jgi:prevent-host-death family protein